MATSRDYHVETVLGLTQNVRSGLAFTQVTRGGQTTTRLKKRDPSRVSQTWTGLFLRAQARRQSGWTRKLLRPQKA